MSSLSQRPPHLPFFLKRSFAQWLRQQDLRFLVEAATLRSWLQAIVSVTLLLLLLTQIPSVDAFMGLSFWTAWLCFLPAFLVGSLIHLKKKMSPSEIAMYTLGTSAGVFFFCASLMVLAKPGAGALFGVFYFFAVAFYGWILRARPQTPFPVVSLLVGTAAAWCLDGRGTFWLTAVLLLPFGLLVMLLLGGWRHRLDLQDRERESLRDTVFAQIQLEQSTQVEVFRRSLTEILGEIHDLNNQIQVIMTGAFLLQQNAAAEPVAQETRETLDSLNQAVRRAVEISQVLHQGRFGTQGRVHDLINTDLLAAIREAVEAVQLLYPSVSLQTELPPVLPLLPVVGGGEHSIGSYTISCLTLVRDKTDDTERALFSCVCGTITTREIFLWRYKTTVWACLLF